MRTTLARLTFASEVAPACEFAFVSTYHIYSISDLPRSKSALQNVCKQAYLHSIRRDGQSKADEVLEFGTYRGDQFVPKSLLRSEGEGRLEVITSKLSLTPNGGQVGIGTTEPSATLDVAGEAVLRGNTSVGGNNETSLLSIDSKVRTKSTLKNDTSGQR